jgi:hypothetical protein
VEEIPARFEPIRAAVKQLDKLFADHGLSLLAGLLSVAFREPAISRFIVGVTSRDELSAILLAAEEASRVKGLQVPEGAELEEVFLNPARWGELEDRRGQKDRQ